MTEKNTTKKDKRKEIENLLTSISNVENQIVGFESQGNTKAKNAAIWTLKALQLKLKHLKEK